VTAAGLDPDAKPARVETRRAGGWTTGGDTWR
jgi:hypothetical protein